MHLMLCLSTLSALVFVALTQHLIQSTMRCENCIDSVNIDSIECIRDLCPVLTVSTYIVLVVWLKSPQSQLSKTFLRIENPLNIKKVMGWNVWMCFDSSIDSLHKHMSQLQAGGLVIPGLTSSGQGQTQSEHVPGCYGNPVYYGDEYYFYFIGRHV